jgi:hypothetical protein
LSSSARLELSNLGKDPAQVLSERQMHGDAVENRIEKTHRKKP